MSNPITAPLPQSKEHDEALRTACPVLLDAYEWEVVRGRAVGLGVRRAYAIAFGRKETPPFSVYTNPRYKAALKWLREQLAETAPITLSEIMEWLASIILAAPVDVNEESNIVQDWEVIEGKDGERRTKVKLVNKMDAAKLYAQLANMVQPDTHHHTHILLDKVDWGGLLERSGLRHVQAREIAEKQEVLHED